MKCMQIFLPCDCMQCFLSDCNWKMKWQNTWVLIEHTVRTLQIVSKNQIFWKVQNSEFAFFSKNWFLGHILRFSKRNKKLNTVFENPSKCRIWIYAFSTNFCPFKLTCLVTLFNRKVSFLKNSSKWTIFNELLSSQNVNVALFARNVECDFFWRFSNTLAAFHSIWWWCKAMPRMSQLASFIKAQKLLFLPAKCWKIT